MKPNKLVSTTLWAALAVAVLDSIASDVVLKIWYNLSPVQVLEYIASALYGPLAFAGTSGAILTGFFIHLLTSLIIAVIYTYAYSRVTLLSKQTVLSGLVYGFGVWLVLNLIVIPVTHIQKSPFDWSLALTSIAWHMFLVGLPVAIITKKIQK